MTPFQHVLVATDLGETARAVIDAGALLARQFDAKLTIVHAVHIPYLMYGSGPYVPPDDGFAQAEQALTTELKAAKERYAKTEGFAVRGDPRTRIPELAEELRADVVVMGTHGRRGLTRALLGSVAERVVRTSAVPVLTVPSS